MKKTTLNERFRKWFYNDVLNTYLIDFHPSFLLIADEIKEKKTILDKESENEYRRIMRVLNSQKFKKMFYRVVDYNLNEISTPKPQNNLWGKIKKFIAKQYLRFFDKELYGSLMRFKTLSGRYQKLNTAADDYISNTTLNERGDRAVVIGVSSKNNREAHKRMRNISNIRIAAIREKNAV